MQILTLTLKFSYYYSQEGVLWRHVTPPDRHSEPIEDLKSVLSYSCSLPFILHSDPPPSSDHLPVPPRRGSP